jgi:hypothetical protein
VPGGELVDSVRAKRLLVLAGVVAVALSVLILWLWSSFPLVALAEVLQGITGGVLGPAVHWSAPPACRNGSDRTSALQPPGASLLPLQWPSSHIPGGPGQCSFPSSSPVHERRLRPIAERPSWHDTAMTANLVILHWKLLIR